MKELAKAKSTYAQLNKDYPHSPDITQARQAIIQAVGRQRSKKEREVIIKNIVIPAHFFSCTPGGRSIYSHCDPFLIFEPDVKARGCAHHLRDTDGEGI